ncbi:hypothetical protein WJX84_008081, partial [Apatococcus fuscideae]
MNVASSLPQAAGPSNEQHRTLSPRAQKAWMPPDSGLVAGGSAENRAGMFHPADLPVSNSVSPSSSDLDGSEAATRKITSAPPFRAEGFRETKRAKLAEAKVSIDIDAGKKARAEAEQAAREPQPPQAAAPAAADQANGALLEPALPPPAPAPHAVQNTTSIGNPSLTMARIGSQLLMDPSQMTAAERAAAAAARVPDPAPRPRRIKRKSLSWKSEAEMTAVRWFRKDEGVLAVHRDATFTEEDAASAAAAPEQDSRMAVGDPSAPAFAAAARMEHQSEANALRQNRDQGWNPPIAADMRGGLAAGEEVELPGQGEDSMDAPFEQQREQANPPVVYLHPSQ